MLEKSLIPFLVIEDDEIDIMNFKRAYTKIHAINPLHFARSGEEALEIIHGNKIAKPFALVVDLNMPLLGGHELIRRVKGLSDYFGTPIFVLTTSSMEADKKEAWELRVNGYFLKELAADSYARKIKAMVDFVNGAEWE